MAILLRNYPYPYKSMLAVCSDLDETPDQDIYFETARYLNTSDNTQYGPGLDLEVGNTIYFDMPDGQLSYCSADAAGKAFIHKLVQSGHIDCLHSFGDHVSNRAQIEQHWSSIQQGERKIEVWIDHAQAPTNVDPDIMQGEGADVNSSAYHVDLTMKTDVIQFVWKGRVTSLVAQNVMHKYSGIINYNAFLRSAKTVCTEIAKGILALLGNQKYKMHKYNRVLMNSTLSDGTSILEFMRCNPSWGGVSVFDNARGIHQVLTPKMLDTLVKHQGCSVLYTHLGKVESPESPYSDKTKNAFKLLASYNKNKLIKVTTTRKLLGYCRTFQDITFEVEKKHGKTYILLTSVFTHEDLSGLTWYVDNNEKVDLIINNKPFADLQRNAADETGQQSVSIPWTPLIFPSAHGEI